MPPSVAFGSLRRADFRAQGKELPFESEHLLLSQNPAAPSVKLDVQCLEHCEASFRAAHPDRSPARRRGPAPEEACVALPALPIQLLLRRRPGWRGTPVAAVADEGPEAPLTHVSREAKKRGLRPGLAQGLARDLVPDLRTGVIGPADLAALETELLRALRTFSPRVERAEERSGAFFVDPTGLEGIYGGAEGWAETVHRYLAGRGFVAAVVVGFRRHRALALALGARGPRVLHSREDLNLVPESQQFLF